MDYNQLTKGQKVWDEILKMKRFIGILQNGYVNSILGFDYSPGHDGERVYYDLVGELRELVIEYLQNQLKKLENEFAEL